MEKAQRAAHVRILLRWIAAGAAVCVMHAATVVHARAPTEREAREAVERHIKNKLAIDRCPEYFRFIRVLEVDVAGSQKNGAYPAVVTFEVKFVPGMTVQQAVKAPFECIPGEHLHPERDGPLERPHEYKVTIFLDQLGGRKTILTDRLPLR